MLKSVLVIWETCYLLEVDVSLPLPPVVDLPGQIEETPANSDHLPYFLDNQRQSL